MIIANFCWFLLNFLTKKKVVDIIIYEDFYFVYKIIMKNLVNVLSIVVLLWTNILTPISYAVEEGFIESDPIEVEENIWEDSFDEVENEGISLDDAHQMFL